MANDQRYVHIGCGKTGTTTLQRKIFPKVCDLIDYSFLRGNQINEHIMRLRLNQKAKRLKIPKKSLVSSEALHSWNPYYWKEYAKKNQIAFGKDSHIIITLREPRSYLTSVYVQMLHEGNILKPNQYFLESDLYSERLNTPKFAIDSFGYKKLINIYLDKFPYVTIQKFETLNQLDFIKLLFDISSEDLSKLQNLFKSKKMNRRYSKKAVELTLKLNNLLNKFGYGLSSSNYDSSIKLIEQKRNTIKSKEMTNNRTKQNKQTRDGERIISYLFKYFKWRRFIQHYFDRIIPYKKYRLNFKELPYIKIDKLIEEYNELPNCCTYNKKNKFSDYPNQAYSNYSFHSFLERKINNH